MTRNLLLLVTTLCGALLSQGCFENRGAPAGPDISGDWKISAKGEEYRLHIIQDGATLTGNMIRLDADEPIDEIKGRINKDGTFDFIRGRLNQDFQGRITSNTSMPLQIGGKFLGQYDWVADKANGLAKPMSSAPESAVVSTPSPSPEPVAIEKAEPRGKSPKRTKKFTAGGPAGAKFSNSNCPKGWRLDTRSAHNETEFICTYRGCSCADKNNGKCDFDAVGALDEIKAPKDYTCVVESDDCTIWCEQSDALL